MNQNKDNRKQLIRNSTAEFLISTGQAGEQRIEARYENETIWLSQKLTAELFDVDVRTVNEYLKNIYDQGELTRVATLRKFRMIQIESKREVSRNLDFYNLDAIGRRTGQTEDSHDNGGLGQAVGYVSGI